MQWYAIDLERLWVNLDHFSLMSFQDPECTRGDHCAERTMQFLKNLDLAYEWRIGLLLSGVKIPPLEEVISAMSREESQLRLQIGIGLPGVKSALEVSKSGNIRFKGETCRCYNCKEVGHLRGLS